MQRTSDFFKHYQQHNGFPYNANTDCYREFEKLADYMNWNQRTFNKKEKYFLEIENQDDDYEEVFALSNEKSSLLNKLHDVIKRYELDRFCEELPRSKTACRKFLKKHLFVNIHDFIAENDTSFRNLKDLRKYTRKNKLYYNLKDAKKDEVHRMMLRFF